VIDRDGGGAELGSRMAVSEAGIFWRTVSCVARTSGRCGFALSWLFCARIRGELLVGDKVSSDFSLLLFLCDASVSISGPLPCLFEDVEERVSIVSTDAPRVSCLVSSFGTLILGFVDFRGIAEPDRNLSKVPCLADVGVEATSFHFAVRGRYFSS